MVSILIKTWRKKKKAFYLFKKRRNDPTYSTRVDANQGWFVFVLFQQIWTDLSNEEANLTKCEVLFLQTSNSSAITVVFECNFLWTFHLCLHILFCASILWICSYLTNIFVPIFFFIFFLLLVNHLVFQGHFVCISSSLCEWMDVHCKQSFSYSLSNKFFSVEIIFCLFWFAFLIFFGNVSYDFCLSTLPVWLRHEW